MPDSTKTKFSTSIIAITGLITAIGSVITILYNVGVIGSKKSEQNHSSKEQIKELKVIEESESKKDIKAKDINVVNNVKPEKIKKVTKSYNLTGKWIDINNPNGKYQINQEDYGSISFIEYSFLFGEWISTATGSGKVTKTRVSIPYTTYLGTNGKFTGKITNNGKIIEGKIQDFNAGISAILNLQKQE